MHFNLGSAYSALKDFQKAEVHYLKSIKFKANNVATYLCLGEVYMELQDLHKAELAFRQVLSIDQNNEKAHDALENLKELMVEKAADEKQTEVKTKLSVVIS